MEFSKEIVLLDLFSGIGGFAKGLEDGGFIIKKHYFSEVDKHAIANYKYNFKNSEYVGAVQNVRGASLGKVDFIAFGSPCQDFSIAGKREGLDGKRSSLILEAIKIIIEKKPTFFIWENVKGTFSSNNGEDFFAILQEFANIGGYNIEWQLLNTLWVLPQNRERIYLVGHLATPGGSFKPVFPFTKNDSLFNGPKGTIGKRSQTEFSSTITKAGNCKATDTYITNPKYSGTLSVGGNSGGLHSDMTIINAGLSKNRSDDKTKIKVERFSNQQQERIYNTNGAMGCLSQDNNKTKIKVAALRDRNGTKNYEVQENDASNTLTSVAKDNILVLNEKSDEYRRMTEIEHERLQGFPDNWTHFGIYEKQVWINKKEKTFKIVEGIEPIASTNRYKLIGNAVTKRFPQMIAQKLIENYS